MRRGTTAGAALLALLALSGCVETLVVGGIATGVVVATDRRNAEVVAGDQRVEFTAQSHIGNRFGDKVHVNTTSYNYNVLLTGEVPDESAKADIEKLVRGVAQVKGVVNELQVAGLSSLSARGNDSYITGKVKSRIVTESNVQANFVKVVTEAGVVYLLGLVTRQEADAATAVARSTDGVKKVVRVFEYINPSPK